MPKQDSSLEPRRTLARTASYDEFLKQIEEYLTNNAKGIINHPVRYIPDYKLPQFLKNLHEKLGGPVTMDELEESAKLAKQDHWLTIGKHVDGLTEAEKISIDIQRSGEFWREPKDLLLTMAVCFLGGMVQGWDQVANGNLGWKDAFGIQVSPRDRAGTLKFAGVQAAPWFSASILGSYLSDPLSEYTGRRKALFGAALCSFSSSIAGSRAKNYKILFGTRILLGLGIGGKASIIPVLESEVLPPGKRGRLLVSWQVSDAAGIFFGSIACYILRSSWRNQILSGAIPAFALLIATSASCESPRWLIIQGRYPEAFTTLLRLRKERRLALKELVTIHYQTQVERMLFIPGKRDKESSLAPNPFETDLGRTSWRQRLRNMLYVQRIRRAAAAAMLVMICQNLSGINILAFLATQFWSATAPAYDQDVADATCSVSMGNITASQLCRFPNATTAYGSSLCVNSTNAEQTLSNVTNACHIQSTNETNSFIFAIGFGAANLVFSCIAYFLVEDKEPEDSAQSSSQQNGKNQGNSDPPHFHSTRQGRSRWRGRRFLLLMSFAAGIITLFLTSMMFRIPENNRARKPMIGIFVIVFTAFYSPGAGAIPLLYCAEIFPNEGRELGMSWSTFWNFLGSGIVALGVPFGINWSPSRLLGIFSSFNAVAFILVWLCVYATNHTTTLEDYSYVFGKRMRDHIRGQANRIWNWSDDLAPNFRWDNGPPNNNDHCGNDHDNYHDEHGHTNGESKFDKTDNDRTGKESASATRKCHGSEEKHSDSFHEKAGPPILPYIRRVSESQSREDDEISIMPTLPSDDRRA